MVVRTRKVGNSTTITIPSQLNIPDNVEFDASIDDQGNIIFTPVGTVSTDEEKSIHEFMDQFQPLMDKLKDK